MPFNDKKYQPPRIPHQYYEDRIVAFIDVLGFSNMVAQSANDNSCLRHLTSAIDEFHNLMWEWEADGNYSSFAFTQFSDSIIVSSLADSFDSFEMLQQVLRGIMMLASRYGILVRGGITRGLLIHDDSLLVGPAMVEAYNLESKSAVYPRIIIDDSIKLAYDKNIEHYVRNHTTFTQIPTQDFIFSKDADGWWYIDYINPSDDYINLCQTVRDLQEYHSDLQDIVKKGLQVSVPYVRTKYQWLENKLNSIKNKNGSICSTCRTPTRGKNHP